MRGLLKLAAAVYILLQGISANAQQSADSCLPVTIKRPQQPAHFAGDFTQYIRQNVDTSLLPDRNSNAIFQLQTDCSGNVINVVIVKSALPAALQQQLFNLILHSPQWIPAKNDGFYVRTVISLSIQTTPTTITVRLQ
ncbi:MAG: hypothetical protein ACRC3B_00615 [Bacteroidia bacterium]